MAAFGIAFFVVTNALIVILIGIAVADSIHIFSQYYEEYAKRPEADAREVVIHTMTEMWRPITLTTFTTVAGFIGLYLASEMPPFKYLGLFSAIGVFVAWLYSLTFLPAALTLLTVKPSKAYKISSVGNREVDNFGRFMGKVGQLVISNSTLIVAVGLIVTTLGIYGAFSIEINEDLSLIHI